MNGDALLTIGYSARLSGVSSYALRHYDEVGVLAPAEVDRSRATADTNAVGSTGQVLSRPCAWQTCR